MSDFPERELEILNTQMCTACVERDTAERSRMWAVVLGLIPYQDENAWCVLLGENIASGICGYGDTPQAAMEDFERAMTQKSEAADGRE